MSFLDFDLREITATCDAKVERPTHTTRDSLGIVVRGEPETDTLEGVLVDPVDGSEQTEGTGGSKRAQAAINIHIPRTYTASLADCTVTLPAPWEGTWRVVGDPQPYDDALCPGPWNRQAKLVRTNL